MALRSSPGSERKGKGVGAVARARSALLLGFVRAVLGTARVVVSESMRVVVPLDAAAEKAVIVAVAIGYFPYGW